MNHENHDLSWDSLPLSHISTSLSFFSRGFSIPLLENKENSEETRLLTQVIAFVNRAVHRFHAPVCREDAATEDIVSFILLSLLDGVPATGRLPATEAGAPRAESTGDAINNLCLIFFLGFYPIYKVITRKTISTNTAMTSTPQLEPLALASYRKLLHLIS